MSGSNSPQWWLHDGTQAAGPFSYGYVALRLQNGSLNATSHVCPVGDNQWKRIQECPEFASVLPAAVPSTPAAYTTSADSSGGTETVWNRYTIGMVISFVLVAAVFTFQRRDPPQVMLLKALKQDAQRDMTANKQQIFNSVHPIGKAKEVVVHDVQFAPGQNGQTFIVYRFTVYWEGPVIKDGFTKLQWVVDPESKAVVGSEILATNGTTNAESQQMAFDFGQLLGHAVRAGQDRRFREERQR